MDIIQFQTTVKSDVIEIPEKYQGKIKNRVRVIVVPESKKSRRRNLIDRLLAHPIQASEFRSLNREDIYAR
jgi:hypothetical protein